MEEHRLTIKLLAEEDRPREKLLLKGRANLTDAELIAILIGSGNKEQTAVELSQLILSQCGFSLSRLAKLSIKDLQRFKGIGEAKAISIAAGLELGRRRKESDPEQKIKISSSINVFNLLHGDLMDLEHEEFWLVFLKRNNEVIKKEMVSKGGNLRHCGRSQNHIQKSTRRIRNRIDTCSQPSEWKSYTQQTGH